jgi:Fe-S-cluster containining protein
MLLFMVTSMGKRIKTMIKIEACKTCTDVCCLRTTYKLTNEDLAAISGYFNVIKLPNGMYQLLKPCVFYNEGCTIYEKRFTGCRIYPIVYYDGKVTTDPSCPGHKEVTREQINNHYQAVLKYMWDITFEAQMRRKNNEIYLV